MKEGAHNNSEPRHVALHVHTEFSLLDGASRVKHICEKAAREGMPGIAITDHGTMYGLFQFYHAAKKAGVKPILGCEVYITLGDHREKGKRSRLYHLVLLAKNDIGYKNLTKIVSEACVYGFYYKPRISKEFVKEHSEGLIALSACLGGEVNNKLLNNSYEEAKEAAESYKEIFGEDFYLEIQDHHYAEDRQVNPKMIQMAQELGLKVVATNDSHYTEQEEAPSHDALLCLQTQKYISDFPRMRFSGHEHLKTEKEMMSLFQDHLPQDVIQDVVINNPYEIFEKIQDYESFCNPGSHLPAPPLPGDHTNETYLRELSIEGTKWRFGDEYDQEKNPERYAEIQHRLDHELKIMNDSGFASYFIVVWDFINWAREHDIPVGPGRGSAAGSLVAYSLGITNIDPLKYDLLFERFLNPERKSMPDIDTDFCIERREEVIQYVREKYGQENVCQIITFNRLTSRSVIKDMARVLEFPYSQAEALAKMIPVVRGKPRSIEWMIGNHDEFAQKYNNDPEAKQVIDLAIKNEGLNKTFGVHAAGVIIADKPVYEVIPVSKNNDGSVITQFPMEESADMGLLKMDFLGLRNLTMINKAIDIIHAHQEEIAKAEGKEAPRRIDPDEIDIEDKATFDMICSGNLSGVFQLETSAGMKQVARDLAPQSMEDVSALIALYRPGPLDTGMIDDFINRKSGKEKIEYDHKLLEPILKNTYGTIVYQEQIMQIAQSLGGFSLGEADLLRRAMGKKKPEVLLPFKDKFVEGAVAQGIDASIPEKLFEQMLAFAEYCFNKSHSTAYGFVTYQTAYLKTHFPVEYLTALFISCAGDTDRIKAYIVEAQRLGIKVAPPNINESDLDFRAKVAEQTIVFGLSAIKGVGAAPVTSILEERSKNGDFRDFFDFCKRIDHKAVNKKTIEGLIKSGAMDVLGAGRKAMIENMEDFINSAKRKKAEEDKGQVNLFAAMGCDNDSFDVTPKYINGEKDNYPEREQQTMEYALLGLFVNNHPMAAMKMVSEAIANYTISDLENVSDGEHITMTALITGFQKKITKAKKIIAILNLEDVQGRMEGVMFSRTLEAHEGILEQGKRVLISGTLSKHSEGDMSVMINEMKDLDNVTMIEFDVDVDTLGDYYTFFHAVKTFCLKEVNKGESLILLKLKSMQKDGTEILRRLSLGPQHAVANTDFVKDQLQAMINKFTGSKIIA